MSERAPFLALNLDPVWGGIGDRKPHATWLDWTEQDDEAVRRKRADRADTDTTGGKECE
jgi:hypothetical protein